MTQVQGRMQGILWFEGTSTILWNWLLPQPRSSLFKPLCMANTLPSPLSTSPCTDSHIAVEIWDLAFDISQAKAMPWRHTEIIAWQLRLMAEEMPDPFQAGCWDFLENMATSLWDFNKVEIDGSPARPSILNDNTIKHFSVTESFCHLLPSKKRHLTTHTIAARGLPNFGSKDLWDLIHSSIHFMSTNQMEIHLQIIPIPIPILPIISCY